MASEVDEGDDRFVAYELPVEAALDTRPLAGPQILHPTWAAAMAPWGRVGGRVNDTVLGVIGPLHGAWRDAGRHADVALEGFRDATRSVWVWWAAHPNIRDRLPRYLAIAMCVVYFAVFERLVWLRHDHFGTFDYDLGMYDQGIWQLAHGRGFMTVRGMHIFGQCWCAGRNQPRWGRACIFDDLRYDLCIRRWIYGWIIV